jgi:predicted AAA+ superfamily ATPase
MGMFGPLTDMTARSVGPIAIARMLEDPVVLLEGPRSVGKSTLLAQLCAQAHGRLLDLDDPAILAAVAADPTTFVSGPGPLFIDEYQKAPVVLDAIKTELNRDGRPGRFVLTGSTRHDALPITAQALTGRLSRLRVDPLSQSEITGGPGTLLTTLLAEGVASLITASPSSTIRSEYIQAMVSGGFPIALARPNDVSRNRWFDEYVKLTLARDLRELAHVRQDHLLAPLLSALAGQSAGVLNMEHIAREVGSDARTLLRYLDLLEKVFLVYRLPAWGNTLSARTSKAPKLHLVDSGVAARLMRLSPAKLAALDPTSQTQLGHLVETFVIGELLKAAVLIDGVGPVGHWRTREGDDVDLVIERDDGAVVAFEVKTAAQVNRGDAKGLRKLRGLLGARFLAGVVLHLGPYAYRMADEAAIFAIPADQIWLS